MIKILNKRECGNLYHYAHFICDCIFPEVVYKIYQFNTVIREKHILQTLGTFSKIYKEIMQNNSIEIEPHQFRTGRRPVILAKKEQMTKHHFIQFRNYIFQRYDIDPSVYTDYPEAILIKRGKMKLIEDTKMKKIQHLRNGNTTGIERREINGIDKVEEYMNQLPGFKAIYLENMSFEEQVKYFNNAKLIVCAHGAAMSNLFFCKHETQLIEVTCGIKWAFFDTITNHLEINHVKCHINHPKYVIECIDSFISKKWLKKNEI